MGDSLENNKSQSKLNEILLHSVFKQTSIGVLLLSLDGTIIDSNPAFNKFIDVESCDSSSLKLLDFIHDDFKKSFQNIVENAKQEVSLSIEAKMLTSNYHTPFWALINLSLSKQTNGNTYLVGIIEDIDARKKIEVQFEKVHKNLKDIKYALDQHSIVGITDSLGRIMYANDKFCEISKYSREELLGQDHRLLNSGHHPKSFFRDLWETILSGKVWHNEVLNKAKDGKLYWVDTTIIPLLNKNKKPYQFISIRTDISDRKEVEQNLKNALKNANAANKIKSEFLANMSHEIRTPMNGIIGMTELALTTELSDEQRDYLEMVRASANSLLTILNDILDLSKIEAGKLEFSNAEFSVRLTIDEIIKSLEHQAKIKNLNLTAHIDPNVPDLIIGDPGRLRQVITNLIGNSLKFTIEGEITLNINVYPNHQIEENKITLHFSVSDTGIGISEDKLGIIFESFTQADSSMTRKHGGTGLGLSISRKIVRMMNGEIWVVSKEKEGSTFHFTAIFELPESQEALIYSKNYENLHGLSVLIVDDNNTNRKIVEELITKWKMKFTSIEHSVDAMDKIHKAFSDHEPFDVIILDLHMPQLDGFELAKKIRDNPKWKEIKIILITSSGQRGDSKLCEDIGVSAYLLKPFKQYELLDAIDAVMNDKNHEKSLITRYTLKESKISQHILLAEDNPVNQKLALYILENWGHTVKVVSNGLGVLSLIDKEKFDLILMDVTMPILDGIETTKIIRENEKKTGKHIPIIAVTAHAMKGDKEELISIGMDDYLSKPLDSNDLLSVIERFGGQPVSKSFKNSSKIKNYDNGKLNIQEVIKKYFDNDMKLFKELKVTYEEKLPAQLKEIEIAITNKKYRVLKSVAHDLKGSYSYFERNVITNLCQLLEDKAANQDNEGLKVIYKQLKVELELLFKDIEHFLS